MLVYMYVMQITDYIWVSIFSFKRARNSNDQSIISNSRRGGWIDKYYLHWCILKFLINCSLLIIQR